MSNKQKRKRKAVQDRRRGRRGPSIEAGQKRRGLRRTKCTPGASSNMCRSVCFDIWIFACVLQASIGIELMVSFWFGYIGCGRAIHHRIPDSAYICDGNITIFVLCCLLASSPCLPLFKRST